MTATMSKTLIAFGAIIAVVVIAYLVLAHRPSPCEAVFEQTSNRFGAKLELIKAKGEVLIGREKVQDLTERAQLAALNLKTCCIVLEGGKLDSGEFLKCKESVAQQEATITRIVTVITDAEAATNQEKPEVAREKVAEADRLVEEVKMQSEGLSRQVDAIKSAPPAPLPEAPAAKEKQVAQKLPVMEERQVAASSTEQEPNDDAFHANVGKLGAVIAGEIQPANNQDWFIFRADTGLKDWVDIKLENRSMTLQPCISVYDGNRKQIADWKCAGNASANFELGMTVEPGKDYYISVASSYGQTIGAYQLSVTARKAYDAYEPNDDIFSAKPIAAGKTIEANIMYNGDTDWYELKGFPAEQLIARIENRSTTLQPCLSIYDDNRNKIGDWQCAGNASANLKLALKVKAGGDYYISVVSSYGQTAGEYRLTVDQGNK